MHITEVVYDVATCSQDQVLLVVTQVLHPSPCNPFLSHMKHFSNWIFSIACGGCLSVQV